MISASSQALGAQGRQVFQVLLGFKGPETLRGRRRHGGKAGLDFPKEGLSCEPWAIWGPAGIHRTQLEEVWSWLCH